MPRKPPPAGDALYALGDCIKLRRLERGYTQRELANVVGVGFTTAQYWEQGHHEPGITNLMRIARACDMPLSRFLSLLDDFEPPVRERAPRPTRRTRRRSDGA